jgi:predicted heme/steroid binding protein
MRRAIDRWAFVAVREDPHWTGALYQSAHAAGRDTTARCAVVPPGGARILWRCWQDGTPTTSASIPTASRHSTGRKT